MATVNSKIQMMDGSWIITQLPSDGKWSKHITFGEIANWKSNENIILEIPLEAALHRDCWEIWREWYGKGVPINCGYRTAKFNAASNGVSNSQHRTLCAYDNGIGAVSDAFFKETYAICYAIAASHNTQCELGRYDWGLHIGFSKLSYTNKIIYSFDKRSKK